MLIKVSIKVHQKSNLCNLVSSPCWSSRGIPTVPDENFARDCFGCGGWEAKWSGCIWGGDAGIPLLLPRYQHFLPPETLILLIINYQTWIFTVFIERYFQCFFILTTFSVFCYWLTVKICSIYIYLLFIVSKLLSFSSLSVCSICF